MEKSSATSLSTVENAYVFKPSQKEIIDGIKLTGEQEEFLLPHFNMLVVGKPGSGKTTITVQLLTNAKLYGNKFDFIFVVSPSY